MYRGISCKYSGLPFSEVLPFKKMDFSIIQYTKIDSEHLILHHLKSIVSIIYLNQQ